MSEDTHKNRRRVTSFDVAKEAGVSRSTVSAVLNNTRQVIISKETEQKVRKAADRLGYLPKLAARSIHSDRSYAIGLISCWNPNSPFVARPMQGIVNCLRTVGYSLTICDLGHSDIAFGVKVAIDYFREGRIDGVLVILSTMADEVISSGVLQLLRDDSVPFVLVNTSCPELEMDEANSDNFHAGYLATRHLLNHGHRRIAYILRREIAPKLSQAEEARYQGYLQALTEAGVSQIDRYVTRSPRPELTAEQGMAVFLQALPRWAERPSAVYAISDRLAAGVMAAAHTAGLRVPDDLAVVGTDDLEIARSTYPLLTSVAQPLQQMGDVATRLLLQRIDGTGPDQPVRVLLPCHLVVRKSCGGQKQAVMDDRTGA